MRPLSLLLPSHQYHHRIITIHPAGPSATPSRILLLLLVFLALFLPTLLFTPTNNHHITGTAPDSGFAADLVTVYRAAENGCVLLKVGDVPKSLTELLDRLLNNVYRYYYSGPGQGQRMSTNSSQPPDPTFDEFDRTELVLLHSSHEALRNDQVVILEIDGDDYKNVLSNSPTTKYNKSEDGFLLAVPKVIQDRTCLLSAQIPRKRLKAIRFSGQLTPSSVADFINDACDTYFTETGMLNVRGLHRRSILDDLVSVERSYDERSLTMGELVDSCGQDLREYFYSGACDKKSSGFATTAPTTTSSTTTSSSSSTSSSSTTIDSSGGIKVKISDSLFDQCDNINAVGSSNFLHRFVLSSCCLCPADPMLLVIAPSSRDERAESESILSPLPACEVLERLPDEHEFFTEYVARSRPVVLKGATSRWPAISKWTNSYFRAIFGNNLTHIKLTPFGEYEGVESMDLWRVPDRNNSNNNNNNKNRNNNNNNNNNGGEEEMVMIPEVVKRHLKFPDLVMVRPEGVEMNFSAFLDLVERGSNATNYSAYLEYTPMKQHFSVLQSDAPQFDFVSNLLQLEMQNVWLSDGRTLGKLHMDQYDNLLCQVSGRKQLILFDPSDNSRLYEGHIVEAMLRYNNGTFYRDRIMQSTAMTMSPVNIVRPDFKKFPKFKSARALNCTIEKGDALYLPAFWWHEVQSYPDEAERRNLAVNFWYTPFLSKEFPCEECKLDVNKRYRHLL